MGYSFVSPIGIESIIIVSFYSPNESDPQLSHNLQLFFIANWICYSN